MRPQYNFSGQEAETRVESNQQVQPPIAKPDSKAHRLAKQKRLVWKR